jgi:hypothetical protein
MLARLLTLCLIATLVGALILALSGSGQRGEIIELQTTGDSLVLTYDPELADMGAAGSGPNGLGPPMRYAAWALIVAISGTTALLVLSRLRSKPNL